MGGFTPQNLDFMSFFKLQIAALIVPLGFYSSINSCTTIEKETVTTEPSLKTYLVGDSSNVETKTKGGFLLMGGSKDVEVAIKWFLERSGGGDVVVIRSSGADGYNKFMFDLHKVNSVETLMLDSRDKSYLPEVAKKIRNAEALFIAGGDQWNYVKYWKDSPVEDALNYLINEKKVPIGGTSAGLAILGEFYFDARNDTVTSLEALENPYNENVTIGKSDFINCKFLANTITDSHYTQRSRQGRHIVFLARMAKDFGLKNARGIGVDEQTAVCIDENGIGKVYGINDAYFLDSDGSKPDKCQIGEKLSWNTVKAYKISGSLEGNGRFEAKTWKLDGGTAYSYSVTDGKLTEK